MAMAVQGRSRTAQEHLRRLLEPPRSLWQPLGVAKLEFSKVFRKFKVERSH